MNKNIRVVAVIVVVFLVAGSRLSTLSAQELLKEQSKEYIQEGIQEQKEGNINSAVTFYEKAIYADPENAKAHNNLGTAYAQQGLVMKAEEEYRKAVALDPNYSIALMNIALLYAQRKDYDTFFEYWKRAQGLDVYSPFIIDDEKE